MRPLAVIIWLRVSAKRVRNYALFQMLKRWNNEVAGASPPHAALLRCVERHSAMCASTIRCSAEFNSAVQLEGGAL